MTEKKDERRCENCTYFAFSREHTIEFAATLDQGECWRYPRKIIVYRDYVCGEHLTPAEENALHLKRFTL